MKLRTKMVLLTLVPLFTVGVLTLLISTLSMKNAILNQSYSGMEAAAISIGNIFSFSDAGDYHMVDGELWKGDTLNISQSLSIVDNIKKQTELDVTIFYNDTRYLTSIVDEKGNRQIGTKASDAVIDAVLKKGNNYGNDDVYILGKRYLCYYIPLKQGNSSEIAGMIFLGQDYDKIDQQMSSSMKQILVPLLVTIAFSAVFAIYLSRRIVDALNKSMSILGRLQNGELGIEVPQKLANRKDVVGDMCRSIMSLDETLKKIITGIKTQCRTINESSNSCYDAADNVLDSIEQISAAVQEVAASTSDQASEVEDAKDNIHKMGTMIEKTSTCAEEISKMSDDMNQASVNAKNTISELSDSMTSVEKAVESISKQTNQTHESVQKINEATEMISSIATQTNLLSLNASIEAARAGEHGKGFAVVATEIQQLAEQSNRSAMQIHDMLAELQQNSEQAVSGMNEVREIVHVQSEKISKTNEIFVTLENGIASSAKGINQINQEANELNDSRKEIIQKIKNVTEASQNIAASMEETASSVESVTNMVSGMKEQSENLRDIAGMLEEAVEIFKI